MDKCFIFENLNSPVKWKSFLSNLVSFCNEVGYFFIQDGMGRLRITKDGVILEGPAEFIKTVKARYIMSRGVSNTEFLIL